MNFLQSSIIFLVPFVLCVVFVPMVINLAKRYGLLDDPKTHKHPAIIHKKPIPRAGGLPILIAIIISSFFFLPMYPQLLIIYLCSIGVVIVGLLDDKYDISPYVRFFTNILFTGIVVFAAGVTIPYVTNPLGGIVHFTKFEFSILFIPQLFAIIWIVWIMNMLNWSKGVDGQMPGIAAISAIIIGIAAFRFPEVTEANLIAGNLSFIVAGAAAGFLVYNFHPAKIFPGYSATILGFLIGILSILSGVKLATALLVMGVPAVDALLTVSRRLLSKRSPFWHDKGHLHHLLLDVGMSQKQIAISYWIMSLILGFIALNLSSRGKLFAIILLLAVVGAVIITLKFILKKNKTT